MKINVSETSKFQTLNLNGEFTTHAGGRLLNPCIAYETFGNLNEDKSNAILICHSLSSDTHVCHSITNQTPGWWEFMVGEDRYIDTNHFFVICINNLGGCFGTTGPLSIDPTMMRPYHDNFPILSMNDIVKAQNIVIDHLGITQLAAVIGSSMGGMIALEWAMAFPEMVKKLVSISSCAEAPASVIAAHSLQREIIQLTQISPDESFMLARKIGLLSYKNTNEFNNRFIKNNQEINNYLDYNAKKFAKTFNRFSYLTFLNAMDNYNPKHQLNSFDKILAKTLVISVDTDTLFPPDAQMNLYHEIKKYQHDCTLIKHQSGLGHDAFYKDEKIGEYLSDFLNGTELNDSNERHIGILAAIGNTPLILLNKTAQFHHFKFKLYAKLEMTNPGGSIKDRPAKEILLNAWDNKLINEKTHIIEYSSGNMGIGLSQVCRYLGLTFICLVDTKTSEKTIQIMRSYGTKIIKLKEPDPITKEFLPVAFDKIKQLLKMMPNSYWINQHGNRANVLAHYNTFKEIHQQLSQIDYLFCATSTCGTITGCSEYIKVNHLNTKIIAVDALGSSIFSNTRQKRIIPGHGAGLVPSILNKELIDDVIFTTAEQAVSGARFLLDKEAILAGGSTGAVLSAIIDYRDHIKPGSQCVMIAPDRGERYLDTIYSDAWCTQNLTPLNNERYA